VARDPTPGMSEGRTVADLHVHTTVSDGTLTLEELPAAAEAAGVECVAVTDHDRIHPGLSAPVTDRGGVTVVRGIELRVAVDRGGEDGADGGDGRAGDADAGDEGESGDEAGRIDLLGYAVDPTSALRDEVDRLQRDRIQRGRRIIELVEERLGVELDIDPGPGVGRPHVARAIADSDADCGYDDAFRELIGEGRPCYVARDVPDFERGVSLLRASCPVVGLAHPLRYADPGPALARAGRLDAIERWYPYDRPADQSPVERAIADHDLLATGGSDAHGRELGRAGLDRAAFGAVRDRLPAPA